MGHDKFGVDLDGAAATCLGLLQTAKVTEGISEIAMDHGGIWFDGESFLITRFGLFQLPQALQRKTKVALHLGGIGFDG
jgi:hypothetical protein